MPKPRDLKELSREEILQLYQNDVKKFKNYYEALFYDEGLPQEFNSTGWISDAHDINMSTRKMPKALWIIAKMHLLDQAQMDYDLDRITDFNQEPPKKDDINNFLKHSLSNEVEKKRFLTDIFMPYAKKLNDFLKQDAKTILDENAGDIKALSEKLIKNAVICDAIWDAYSQQLNSKANIKFVGKNYNEEIQKVSNEMDIVKQVYFSLFKLSYLYSPFKTDLINLDSFLLYKLQMNEFHELFSNAFKTGNYDTSLLMNINDYASIPFQSEGIFYGLSEKEKMILMLDSDLFSRLSVKPIEINGETYPQIYFDDKKICPIAEIGENEKEIKYLRTEIIKACKKKQESLQTEATSDEKAKIMKDKIPVVDEKEGEIGKIEPEIQKPEEPLIKNIEEPKDSNKDFQKLMNKALDDFDDKIGVKLTVYTSLMRTTLNYTKNAYEQYQRALNGHADIKTLIDKKNRYINQLLGLKQAAETYYAYKKGDTKSSTAAKRFQSSKNLIDHINKEISTVYTAGSENHKNLNFKKAETVSMQAEICRRNMKKMMDLIVIKSDKYSKNSPFDTFYKQLDDSLKLLKEANESGEQVYPDKMLTAVITCNIAAKVAHNPELYKQIIDGSINRYVREQCFQMNRYLNDPEHEINAKEYLNTPVNQLDSFMNHLCPQQIENPIKIGPQ